MKKLFLFFQLEIIVNLCFSQSILIRNNYPVLGEYVQEALCDTTGIYEGQASANQIWDFSNLTITSSVKNYVFANDTIMTGCLIANLYIRLTPFNPNNASEIGYLDDSLTLKQKCSDYFSNPPFNSGHTSYIIPRKIFQFPFIFNNFFVDSFYYSGSNQGLSWFTSFDSHGINTVIYDAWGTIILPSGTSSCLRIRTLSHTIDTTFSNGNYYYGTTHKEEYAFYTSGNYIVKIIYDYNFPVTNPNYKRVWVMIRNLPTEIFEHKQETNIIISPNPASTEFQISNFNFQTNDEIILRDVLGKIYFRKRIPSPTSDLRLQTSDFSNGIYFLEVKTKEGVLNKKVLVQH